MPNCPTDLGMDSELDISSPAVIAIIASTHFAYRQKDGQAELSWVEHDGANATQT